jgi:Protein of unknown function (DUF4050)
MLVPAQIFRSCRTSTCKLSVTALRVMNEERWSEPGGGFVRRMSALARRGRTRSKRDMISPSSSTLADATPVENAPFVNHGLEFWNKQREEWTAPTQRRRRGLEGRMRVGLRREADRAGANDVNGNSQDQTAAVDADFDNGDDTVRDEHGGSNEEQMAATDAEELYNELLAPRYTPFPRRVPLGELIEVLLDVWEQDGVMG